MIKQIRQFWDTVKGNIHPKVNAREAEYSNQIKDIRRIDRGMIGRYCGSLEDKVMQTMCCYDVALRFPSDQKYAHVDIGVLFGGSVLAKLSVLKRLNSKQTVVAIDPFDGYYGKEKDPGTQIEVTEENFLRNIQKFGFDNQQVRIIKEYSTKEIVGDILSQYRVISLMIDGDHTYNGVRSDWEKYSGLIEVGGCVIFDDYQAPQWPDVTRFVDELIASKLQGWEILGKLDTTLIMKHIR